ncbi:MAG TPA: hypothetical protein VF920_16565, partial [Dongiaceae bacterium]
MSEIDRGDRAMAACRPKPLTPKHWVSKQKLSTWRLNMTTTHKGACFCGTVQIEVVGEPEGMGYCHCQSCRSWSGGPVNAFSLWKPEAVRIAAGA